MKQVPENQGYDAWHRQQEEVEPTFGVWYRWVDSAVADMDLNSKTVLEIGCGRGFFAAKIGRNHHPRLLYGCDYSAKAIDIAQQRFPEENNIVWKQEDIQKMSFENASFDTVISCETIEHIPHPGKGLRELYRVLKPGGRLFLTFPNYFNFFGLWCLYRKLINKPYSEGGQPYVNYILFPSIRLKLKLLGFRVEHFHSSELILPARVPKTYYSLKTPKWLSIFGHRTYYILRKV
jgi:SAM-dependent methyltransferase